MTDVMHKYFLCIYSYL